MFNLCAFASSYNIVDTGQVKFYDGRGEIKKPARGDRFYGQDAQFQGLKFNYANVGNGIVEDKVTGLMWTKNFKVLSYKDALKYAAECSLGGYKDWRLPSIKELYSLIDFSGVDISGRDARPENGKPFINTEFFDFKYGANGRRPIDSQYMSATVYTGKTMNMDSSVFGVNFADGRIKAYPLTRPHGEGENRFCVILVRGNPEYGKNKFKDNGDGTVEDGATGLMWAKDDGKKGLNFEDALKYAEEMNAAKYLGHSDWRVPNAKELQSIVDYGRSPSKTNSAAIDGIFETSRLPDGEYPYFWSSTTHMRSNGRSDSAVYICFGRALGLMRTPHGAGETELMDVHGAGAQRAEWKSCEPSKIGTGMGPQGDLIRGRNYVRLVRDI